MEPIPTTLVDAEWVADRYGVTVPWVRRSAASGYLPCVNRDRVLLFDPAAVEARFRAVANHPCDATKPVRLVNANTLLKNCALPRSCFDRLVASGQIPHFVIGRKRYFNEEVAGAIVFELGVQLFHDRKKWARTIASAPPLPAPSLEGGAE